MLSMKLTSHLPDDRRAHVEGRLRANLMAWLTTVRPDGRPDSVPVWFLLRDDETILIYSQAAKIKLRTGRVTRAGSSGGNGGVGRDGGISAQ
jgi:predicted pyridoxine 5'-phosphate oxidase superfamily flavin-nucleotide-binding protein